MDSSNLLKKLTRPVYTHLSNDDKTMI